MEQQKFNKLKTYLGFAMKSGSLKYGNDNISKKARLIIISNDLSNGSLDKLIKRCNQNNVKVRTLNKELFSNLFKEGVKVVSVENYDLSNAIYQLMEEN